MLGFRFALGRRSSTRRSGCDYALVVHGEQTFELHRPVYAGDVLTSVRVADIRDAGRNELMHHASPRSPTPTASRSPRATSTIVSRGTAAGKDAS